MTTWLDLGPAGRHMTDLLRGLDDDQLGAPTPCEKTSIGVLVDHVGGLSLAFTQAAAKQLGAETGRVNPPTPRGSGPTGVCAHASRSMRSPKHGGRTTHGRA